MNTQDFLISLASGACAGTATDLFFYPIDTLKTRLQAQGGFFNNGGWSGIYKGLSSTVVASAPSAALFFITYDSCKALLRPTLGDEPINHMASASLGEVTACLVRVPAEVLKQRTQTSQFRTPLEALKAILKGQTGETIRRGLYRGWWSTILREIPFTMIQFPLYEKLKKLVAEREENGKCPPLKGALCGSLAGGIAAALTTPLDVLKTRIMLAKQKVSVTELVASMVREEGLGVFLKGIGPRVMWISCGGAVFLGGYESVKWVLEGKNEGQTRL